MTMFPMAFSLSFSMTDWLGFSHAARGTRPRGFHRACALRSMSAAVIKDEASTPRRNTYESPLKKWKLDALLESK